MTLLYLIILLTLLWVIPQRNVYYCYRCNSYYDGLGYVHIFSIGNDFIGDKICKQCKKNGL